VPQLSKMRLINALQRCSTQQGKFCTYQRYKYLHHSLRDYHQCAYFMPLLGNNNSNLNFLELGSMKNVKNPRITLETHHFCPGNLQRHAESSISTKFQSSLVSKK
ncbi:unnamed protein product, partial [Meganyctiphanes norvegica]